MAKKDNQCCSTPYKTSCGGQALLEGIMMRGPEKQAIVVRKTDGTLDVTTSDIKPRTGWKNWPFIRGLFIFCGSMVNGVKALMHSAEVSEDFTAEEEELTSLQDVGHVIRGTKATVCNKHGFGGSGQRVAIDNGTESAF